MKKTRFKPSFAPVLLSAVMLAVTSFSASAQNSALRWSNEELNSRVSDADLMHYCSKPTQEAQEVEFVNLSSETVSFHWIDFNCKEGGGPVLAPGERSKGVTYPQHYFAARDAEKEVVKVFGAEARPNQFVIRNEDIEFARAPSPYGAPGDCSPRTTEGFTAEFVNRLDEPIYLQWVGFECEILDLREIPAKSSTQEQTYPDHVFRFVDRRGRELAIIGVTPGEKTYHISGH